MMTADDMPGLMSELRRGCYLGNSLRFEDCHGHSQSLAPRSS
jgi:hypothetical protein